MSSQKKVEVLNEEGEVVPKENMGNLVIKLPLPPGCSSEIWNDKSRFYEEHKGLPVLVLKVLYFKD